MSEQRTEFDKWFDDYEHNNDIRLAINYGAYEIAGDAWQAATAETNKRMAELEGEVAELKEDLLELRQQTNIRCSQVQERDTKIYELQANNHDLREALDVCKQYITEAIIDDKYHEASCGLDELYLLRDKAINLYNVAISTTPAESLAKRDELKGK